MPIEQTQQPRSARLAPGQFFGETRRSVTVPGLTFSEGRYAADVRLPAHAHRTAHFCLLVHGAYTEMYGGRRVTYDRPSVVFQPAETEHSGAASPAGAVCFHAELGPEWLERALGDHGQVPPGVLDQHGGEVVQVAHRLHRAFRWARSRGGAARQPELSASLRLRCEGLALEMLAAVMDTEPGRAERRVPGWLVAAADLLHDEFARPLTAAGIAAVLGIPPVRLARAFRRHYGESIGARLRAIRVEYARQRLADPAACLAAVACEAGFADQSHFTRVFKQQTGMSPGAYRSTTCAAR
jgi:AraC family transcriptional regulator